MDGCICYDCWSGVGSISGGVFPFPPWALLDPIRDRRVSYSRKFPARVKLNYSNH